MKDEDMDENQELALVQNEATDDAAAVVTAEANGEAESATAAADTV
jgi:hypothetical protein